MGVRGPAPDPQALRRDRASDKATWRTLPSTGRQGDAPGWPLSRASVAERKQWAREWARPQAVEWERADQVEEVAVYVRNLLAQKPDMSVLIRQQEALGLSQPGLDRRRWRIGEIDQPKTMRHDDPDLAARKAKLRTITGGAA